MDSEHKYLNKFIRTQKTYLTKERERIALLREQGAYPQTFSMPVGIQLELTAKCNLACKHCYNLSDPKRLDAMQIENWKKTVNDIVSAGGIFQCILSGGEPLMFGDKLFDIIEPLDKDGTAFVLITNGFLVNKNIVERLHSYQFYWVQVSIDHLHEKEHDEFRGRTGSWKKAVNAVELFSLAGFPTRIAHSVTPDNIEYIGEFIDFSYELGASSLILGEIMLSGRVAENRYLLMNEDNLNEMYAVIEKNREKYASRMSIISSLPEQISKAHKSEMPNTAVIIRPNGDVRLDCTMPFVIGNVLERPFPDIWRDYGNTCYRDERVQSFIYQPGDHINHYSTDIRLYP